MKFKIIGLVFFLAAIIACKKEITQAFTGFSSPDYFPTPVYNFNNNPITEDGFVLGRKLFYDASLSANNTISCGFCHIQTSAFTQHGHSVSHGIFDSLGTRNTPPIMNLAWSPSLMWDGGIADLDLQPIAPITNHVEMGNTMDNVLKTLRNSPVYPQLFQKAFGTPEITTTRLLKALSQFMLMCVSNQSKYDSVIRHQATFTETENAGYAIFKKNCSGCHKEPLFTDYSFRNNGLSPNNINDVGRYDITLQDNDRYKFKVPSLRNLYYTAPYMHDGRFLTLDGVLDFYTGQVTDAANLDPLLKQNGHLGFSLSNTERQQLLAFLQTLNDKNFVENKMLSEQ